MTDRLNLFMDEHEFLSNFYESAFVWDGRPYRNAEAAFQSAKTLDPAARAAFSGLDPDEAKRMGRQLQLRPDWEDVKEGVMEDVLRAKFTQNPALIRQLLATGDRLLEEGNTWGDTYWGVDLFTHEGRNVLGRILMKIRAELRESRTGSEA